MTENNLVQVEETTNPIHSYTSSMEEKLKRVNSGRTPAAKELGTLPFRVKHLIKELMKHEVGSVCKFDSKCVRSNDYVAANSWLFRHGIRKVWSTNRKNCEWGAITLCIRSTYKLNDYELIKAYRTTLMRDVLDLEKSDIYASKISYKFRAKLPDELLQLQKNITLVNEYTSTCDIQSDYEETEVPSEPIVTEHEVQLEHVAQPVIKELQVKPLDDGLNINFEHIVHKDIYTAIHTLNAMNLLTNDLIQSLNEKIKEQIIDTNIVQAILDNGK
jgi:hypothetical protein